jgi:hypothetical protein
MRVLQGRCAAGALFGAAESYRRVVALILSVAALALVGGISAYSEHPKSTVSISQTAPLILWNQAVPQYPADPCLAVAGHVESRGVAVGPDENPVALGQFTDPANVVVVAKYDRTSGERLWCTTFPVKGTTSGGSAFVVPRAVVAGLAIDSSGTIFIGGDGGTGPVPSLFLPRPGPTPRLSQRYFVTRCSANGICSPTVTFINPPIAGSHDEAIGGIAIGPDDNPVLTGLARVPAASPNRTQLKLLTVKLSGATLGVLGMVDTSSNPSDPASSEGVAVDSLNNIYVTGSAASTSKYDAQLSPIALWTTPVAGARIAVRDDASGVDIAVLGSSGNAPDGSRRLVVTRMDGDTGGTLWANTYGPGSNDVIHDVALDDRGNIFVVGRRRSHRNDALAGPQDGVLMSVGPVGALNWAAVFPANRRPRDGSHHSFVAVAIGPDQNPVVLENSDLQSGRRVMNVLKYGGSTFTDVDRGGPDRGGGRKDDKGEPKLAWDEPANTTVRGFWVCIDQKTGTECQDIGLPEARTLRSTPSGMLTYTVPLSTLASFTPHARRISVIAYNDGGTGPSSVALSVRYSDLHRQNMGR